MHVSATVPTSSRLLATACRLIAAEPGNLR
jgi:hypothetical protein